MRSKDKPLGLPGRATRRKRMDPKSKKKDPVMADAHQQISNFKDALGTPAMNEAHKILAMGANLAAELLTSVGEDPSNLAMFMIPGDPGRAALSLSLFLRKSPTFLPLLFADIGLRHIAHKLGDEKAREFVEFALAAKRENISEWKEQATAWKNLMDSKTAAEAAIGNPRVN